jgi:dihydroorotate dehydrogenase electron transfer subunit
MKQLEQAKIIGRGEIAPNIFSLWLHAPGIAQAIKPGQFVMVYLDRGEMLLPRPISVCRVTDTKTTLELVYQTVGKGTEYMSRLELDQSLRLLGPLGNGFNTEAPKARVALVGGGIGVPPLLMLAKALKDTKVDVYMGFREQPILLDEFQALADNVHVATDNGSYGYQGTALDILKKENQPYDEIFACGPRPLLKALAEYAKTKGIPCQVCMEERMACGLGTCVGCAVKTADGYQKCCVDGPVFYSDKVVWDE